MISLLLEGAAVLLIVGILLGAAAKPDTFRVERAILIDAAPEEIFPLIDDLRRWEAWSPWEKLDPGMERTYSGPSSGAGAAYAWEGNNKVGKGRMEITESVPPARVALRLDFLKPFEGHNVAEFALTAEGSGTKVTWAMGGPTAFLPKILSVFVSMDRMIGRQFEAGLANLKAAAEEG